ncbi:NnrU family protein [Thalassobaculum sp.]|uniref:NnrU family protein n=1 Tax=Thalassobaculum sp. TaxID=2022740 RepID=UPI0032EF2DBB
MLGTIDALFIGLAAFVGGHFVLSSPPLRDPLVRRLGEERFRVLYASAALAALLWTILAYEAAPYIEVWLPPRWTLWVPNLVMPLAAALLVAGVTTRNPTAVGGEGALDDPNAVRGVLTITRHPFLNAVGLWALAHLAANGDLASMALFGGMALLAYAGMPALDAKMQRRLESAWGPMALTTSCVPFLAAMQGRVRVDWPGIGLWRPALGLMLWAALYGLHPLYTGVWPHP